jgi:glyoxylase-like metal-dependent hydrolase (beta-lactamase superfamily II)
MVNIKPLAIAGLTALSLHLSTYAEHAAAAEDTSKVADGVYLYAPGDGYTSMFVVTSEGVIAVEPVNTGHAQGMLEAIGSVTDKPVRYLLHSHNHWDHSRGGQVFRDAGAKILAHKEAYDWMKANPHPDMALPDEGWDGSREDITLGDTTIEMHYIGMSHGLGMTVFRVAQQKVAYIADVVTPNRVLFAIVPDFNINEWVRALSQVEQLDFDKAVFSHIHGDAPFGSKADVVKNREFIQDLQGAIVAEFKKGTDFTKIPDVVTLPKYEKWAMYNEWLSMNVWRVMLDMYMGPFPWRPAPEFEK